MALHSPTPTWHQIKPRISTSSVDQRQAIPITEKLGRGEAVRIFTGAVVPSGVDTVAMQEDCSSISQPVGDRDTAVIAIPPGLKFAANVRAAGEDVRQDDAIIRTGDTIRPQDVAVAASLGRSVLRCYMRPRVAVVSTGDEIVRAGDKPLDLGQVYDANSPMLGALVGLAGCDVTDLGIWPDTRTDVTDRLHQAASQFDVVLTSGGASLGEEDHMSSAIEELGSRHFWQIAVKPGRPLMLGRIDDSIIIGLPGNPVAVFVCFLIYVRPLVATARRRPLAGTTAFRAAGSVPRQQSANSGDANSGGERWSSRTSASPSKSIRAMVQVSYQAFAQPMA